MTHGNHSQSSVRRPLFGLAPEGLPFIGAGLALTGLAAAISRRLVVPALALTGLVTYFFRDPERQPPGLAEYLYAPADGRIMAIDEIDEQRFIKGPAWRIATFLSVFDVHINRSPAAGVVSYREYIPGSFLAAWDQQAPEVNERHYLGLDTANGPIMIVQIAGLVARRIVCWTEPGEEVAASERVGLIKFGSRTDLIFPRTMGRPLVSPGMHVAGGVTPLALVAAEND